MISLLRKFVLRGSPTLTAQGRSGGFPPTHRSIFSAAAPAGSGGAVDAGEVVAPGFLLNPRPRRRPPVAGGWT